MFGVVFIVCKASSSGVPGVGGGDGGEEEGGGAFFFFFFCWGRGVFCFGSVNIFFFSFFFSSFCLCKERGFPSPYSLSRGGKRRIFVEVFGWVGRGYVFA